MPIFKAVGLLLDFLYSPSMKVGQDGVLSTNLSEGVVVHYLNKGYVCKI
jgi:hypothetical protein